MEKLVDDVNHGARDDGVFEAIHEIMHLFRAQQYHALRATAHALTHMENRALGYVARHPGASQRELVQRSGRDKAQVTRLVQGLRDKGMVEVRADEADRRGTRLYLTADGAAVHAEVRQHGLALAAQALSGLDDAERGQLEALLGRVQEQLRAGAAHGGSSREKSEG